MTWLIWSIAAAATWGVINLVDKVVVEKYISKPEVYLLFGGIASLLPASFVLLFWGIESIKLIYVVLSIITGFILVSYTYFFFISLQLADAPIIVALFQIVPLFSAIWGRLFLNEKFTLPTYIGMFLVVIGAIIVSLEKINDKNNNAQKTKISSALILMLISTFLASIGYAIQDYVLNYINVNTLFFWARIGDVISVSVLFLIKPIRTAFINTIKTMLGFALSVNLINELLNTLAIYMLMIAYSLGSLSLVTTCAATQPIFVLFYVRSLNKIRPNTIPDTGDRRLDHIKIPAIIIIIIGIYLLS